MPVQTDRHSTPQPLPNKHVNTSQEALLSHPSDEAAPTELHLGTHLLEEARIAAPISAQEL